MGPGMIQVLPDSGALAAAAALALADTLRRSVEGRGRATWALAGGSTPAGAYRALARDHRDSAPWDRVLLLLGDERMVPPDHEDSNYGMARRELLEQVPIPEEAVLRVRTELGSPEAAAAEYERRLRIVLGGAPGDVPALDLVLLGLGEDGHTASLFPGCPAVEEDRRLVGWCPAGAGKKHARVTLTLPVLNRAREVVFLVSGASKADVLRSVLEGGRPAAGRPAARVRPSAGRTRWLVDADAARKLSPGLLGQVQAGHPGPGKHDDDGQDEPMENT